MDAITAGIAGNAAWTGMQRLGRSVFGLGIKITDPLPRDFLADRRALGNGSSYIVRGTLKRLPRDHRIWVLTQEEATGRVWPQAFSPVEYNPQQGTWEGRVNGTGQGTIRILAAVAPPTSNDYFNYFQILGRLRKFQFEPLSRIPPECQNIDWVQAKIPSN